MVRNYLSAGLYVQIYVEAERYVGIVPLAQNSPAGTSFQWDIEGWLNRRVDSNQAIDSTLQVDSTFGLNHLYELI